mmetsp:Transcript_17877/g.31471  ORF Transcript_17877/g.31471 Transcript_17877/m.31471 type:complete len:110 (-) Transcript_17877:9-338(-)
MPTLAPMSEGESSAPDAFVGGPSQEIESVRELNRLLESALRMGGDGSNADASSAFGGVPLSDRALDYTINDRAGTGSSNTTYSLSESAASWRLDTARRLSSVSIIGFWS